MALLPPFFLDTVAAIGVGDDEAKRQWIGTGFLYGNLVDPNVKEEDKKRWRLWIITNRHVLADLKRVYVKFNSAVDGKSTDYTIPLLARNGRPRWIGHPDSNVDVAAIAIVGPVLQTEKRRFAFFRSESHVATGDALRANNVTEGDRVFVLGFPMGLVATERQYVICRTGAIARIRDYLEKKATDFLVDAMVLPGNSGGPVVSCPAALAITGTTAASRSELIGIVKSYIPYRDMAISSQTKQPRIVFEENSGLAAVEPADAIIETVAAAEKRLKSRVARAAKKQAKEGAPTSTGFAPPQP